MRSINPSVLVEKYGETTVQHMISYNIIVVSHSSPLSLSYRMNQHAHGRSPLKPFSLTLSRLRRRDASAAQTPALLAGSDAEGTSHRTPDAEGPSHRTPTPCARLASPSPAT